MGNKRTLSALAILFAFLVLLWGCGGGGGGGTSDSGSGGNNSGYTDLYVRAVASPTDGTPIDPDNLVTGQQVQFQLVGTSTTTNVTSVLTASTWRVNAPASVASISGTGLLTTVGGSSSSYTATAVFGGRSYTSSFKVQDLGSNARVTGIVQISGGAPASGIPVTFVDAAGTTVGTATTTSTGAFSAVVPPSATRFKVDLSAGALNDSFYNQYDYNNVTYSVIVAGCASDLPTLTVGNSVALSSAIVVYTKAAGSPPPPPAGCR